LALILEAPLRRKMQISKASRTIHALLVLCKGIRRRESRRPPREEELKEQPRAMSGSQQVKNWAKTTENQVALHKKEMQRNLKFNSKLIN